MYGIDIAAPCQRNGFMVGLQAKFSKQCFETEYGRHNWVNRLLAALLSYLSSVSNFYNSQFPFFFFFVHEQFSNIVQDDHPGGS